MQAVMEAPHVRGITLFNHASPDQDLKEEQNVLDGFWRNICITCIDIKKRKM